MKYLMVLSALVLSTVSYGSSKVVETPAASQKKAVAVQPAVQPAEQQAAQVTEEEADLIVMDDEAEAALEATIKQ